MPKRIYTCSFGAFRHISNRCSLYVPVNISSKPPDGYKGISCDGLKPTYDLVQRYKSGQIGEKQYTIEYLTLLLQRKVDFGVLVDALENNSVLLCYEKAGDFCHRRIVADLIQKFTGVGVIELTNMVG